MENRIIVNQSINKGDIHIINRSSARLLQVPENRLRKLEPGHVDKLVEDILRDGVLQNVVATQTDDNSYRLIAGAHRLAACHKIWEQNLDTDRPVTLPVTVITVAKKDEEIIEIAENLIRKELTKAERDEFMAKMLELLGNGQKTKTVTGKKRSLTVFKAPTIKDVTTTLGISDKTFRRDFKAYQQEKGVTNGWPKLTEAEYDGFIQWFKDRAKETQEQEKAAQENKQKADEDRASKEKQKKYQAIVSSIKAYSGTYGKLTEEQWEELRHVNEAEA